MMVNAGGITPDTSKYQRPYLRRRIIDVRPWRIGHRISAGSGLDNLLSRIDARKLGIVAAVLLVLYCADQVYSAQHPNVGAGITDYKGSDTSLEAPTPYEIRKRSDGLS